MNQKKAKQLKRAARAFVLQTGKPLDIVQKEYDKIKKIYKLSKGQI